MSSDSSCWLESPKQWVKSCLNQRNWLLHLPPHLKFDRFWKLVITVWTLKDILIIKSCDQQSHKSYNLVNSLEHVSLELISPDSWSLELWYVNYTSKRLISTLHTKANIICLIRQTFMFTIINSEKLHKLTRRFLLPKVLLL